jgi:hypothetical protein
MKEVPTHGLARYELQIDEQKLMSFIGQVAADLGGAFTLPIKHGREEHDA